MPILSLYRHGVSAGVPPSRAPKAPSVRGDVGGWSQASCRRNVRFLWSVHHRELSGHGYAATLTLRDCPEDHEQWTRMRNALFKRLRRVGLIRCHWVTEWQRRGCPHLHGAFWFPEPVGRSVFSGLWRGGLADAYGASDGCQYVTPIYDSLGWFQYVSKHAARGVSHYQRCPENVPAAWNKTGRMWGHTGEWPLSDAIRFELDWPGFWSYRRLLRGWRCADARAERSARRIASARRMLKCPDRGRSSVHGVSEWFPEQEHVRVLSYLASLGHAVEYA